MEKPYNRTLVRIILKISETPFNHPRMITSKLHFQIDPLLTYEIELYFFILFSESISSAIIPVMNISRSIAHSG
jgi:hypothetical protein